MRASIAFLLLTAAIGTKVAAQSTSSTSAFPKASAVDNNPAGVIYKAVLPEEPYFKPETANGGNVKGEITAVAGPDEKGVIFSVRFSNLPKSGGPFMYHLHVDPVPADGNCTKTLAHLDPTARGEQPPCDANDGETCQVGDLSGKHGKIPEGLDTFNATYPDQYASTLEGIGAFFGNRSFVFHFANKTRISCANFELVTKPDQPSESDCPNEPPTETGSGHYNGTIPSSTGKGPVPTTAQTAAPSQTSVVTAAGSSIKTGGVSAMVLAAAIAFML